MGFLNPNMEVFCFFASSLCSSLQKQTINIKTSNELMWVQFTMKVGHIWWLTAWRGLREMSHFLEVSLPLFFDLKLLPFKISEGFLLFEYLTIICLSSFSYNFHERILTIISFFFSLNLLMLDIINWRFIGDQQISSIDDLNIFHWYKHHSLMIWV